MSSSTLVIGYGNVGRRDDGLGPACAERLDRLALPGVTVDADYQLTVEDAAAAARCDQVVFVDAAVRGDEPFAFFAVPPADALSFSTHSVEPGAVLALAHLLFDSQVRGYALAIRGYAFNEFGEGLSAQAARNLETAVAFLQQVIVSNGFAHAAGATATLAATHAALN